MTGDPWLRLGLALLAAVILFSLAEPTVQGVSAPSVRAGAYDWLLLLLVALLGLVGRRWLHRRDARAKTPRRWNRRKRALPPAPEPPTHEG